MMNVLAKRSFSSEFTLCVQENVTSEMQPHAALSKSARNEEQVAHVVQTLCYTHPQVPTYYVLTHISDDNVQSESFSTEAEARARFNVLDNGAIAAMLVDGDFNELDFYANNRGGPVSRCALHVRAP